MTHVKKIALFLLISVAFQSCAVTIPNAKTATFKVAGNCEQCEAVIEKAVYKKGIAEGEWNATDKTLKINYDGQQITTDELLKKVAYSGYDNELYFAPDDAYNQLPACCHYARLKKTQETETSENQSTNTEVQEPKTDTKYALSEMMVAYFSVKEALVSGNSTTAATQAKELLKTIQAINKTELEPSERAAWDKVYAAMQKQTTLLAETGELDTQRQAFSALSESVIDLINAFGSNTTVYIQHCPMYNDGADWLSLEKVVKNPYYGSSMLTCGKTIATIEAKP